MKKIESLVLVGSCLAFLVFIGTSYYFLCSILNAPVNLSKELQLDSKNRYLFSIEKGTNLKRVNAELSHKKILSSSFLVTSWARVLDKHQVKAGDYWISSSDTAKTLVEKFGQGDIAQHSITFPEGWSFNQWLSKLAEIPQFAVINDLNHRQLLDQAAIDLYHPEGWFFPDTYYYSKNTTIFTLLKQAHQRMRVELEIAWKSKDDNLPYTTSYEALIMASIIEKETGQANERTEISGVFVRRLKQGMRLQTDPTVIYGMGDDYDGNIRLRDLRAYTAYNTYRIDGLPPTPIAMPGLASIEAALHPKSGSSLYFVARGDGSHHFSDTISEHQEAVRKFQIEQRVKNYQSAPQHP